MRDSKQQYKVEFFNQVLECAIQSAEECFLQLKEHYSLYGMTCDIPKSSDISEENLQQQHRAWEAVLTKDDMCCNVVSDLGEELKALLGSSSAKFIANAVLEYMRKNKN